MWPTLRNDVMAQHARLDVRIARWIDAYTAGGGHIHCTRGYGNCCSLPVNATFTEAASVAGALNDEQAASLREYAQRLRNQLGAATDLKSYLRLHRQCPVRCPFLNGERTCGIYSVRPWPAAPFSPPVPVPGAESIYPPCPPWRRSSTCPASTPRWSPSPFTTSPQARSGGGSSSSKLFGACGRASASPWRGISPSWFTSSANSG